MNTSTRTRRARAAAILLATTRALTRATGVSSASAVVPVASNGQLLKRSKRRIPVGATLLTALVYSENSARAPFSDVDGASGDRAVLDYWTDERIANASDGKDYICSGSAVSSGSGRLVATAGGTGTRALDGYTFSTISGCNFGGGSSGGPWLKDYSNSSGLGYLKSVTSWGPTGSTAHSNGPFFRTAVRTLFNDANADW